MARAKPSHEEPEIPENVRAAFQKILHDVHKDETSTLRGDRDWRYRGKGVPADPHPLARRDDATKPDYDLIHRLAEVCSPWLSKPPPRLNPHKVQMIVVEPLFAHVTAKRSHVRQDMDYLRDILASRKRGLEAKAIITAAMVFCDVLRVYLPSSIQDEFVDRVQQIVFDATSNLNWGVRSRLKRDKMLLADEVLHIMTREKRGARKADRLRVAYRLGVLCRTEKHVHGGPTDDDLRDLFRKREELFKQHEARHKELWGNAPEQVGFSPFFGSRFAGKALGQPYAAKNLKRRFKLRSRKRG